MASKSLKRLLKGLSFTVKVDPFRCRKFTTSELSRGTGVHRTYKGKGSYTRKHKHKGNMDW